MPAGIVPICSLLVFLDDEKGPELTYWIHSDTTAATLTNIFFHLSADLTLYKKLQTELDALPDLSHDKLTGVKLLDAVINETLRLHPAVPSGTQRLSPPGGMTIGNTYIPGDVMVCIPSHTLFRGKKIILSLALHQSEMEPYRYIAVLTVVR